MSTAKKAKDHLGNRMKDFYEFIPKTKLMRRTPVIIRIDGKAFHTFTRGFRKPFDERMIHAMQDTAKYLCENIQGCVLGYCQSDEISLLLIDYQKLEASAWFDYDVQKMCSISASMATLAFNRYFGQNCGGCCEEYSRALKMGAVFDARVFNIPREEAANYFFWRQLDASRNSIQMEGQANFSHKELQCKSCEEIKEMLREQRDIDWNGLPVYLKRGSCVVKAGADGGKTVRHHWTVDMEIPIFKGESREYIEKLVYVGQE